VGLEAENECQTVHIMPKVSGYRFVEAEWSRLSGNHGSCLFLPCCFLSLAALLIKACIECLVINGYYFG
jgi:hypothetical protein